MRRRHFLLAGSSLLASPLALPAQPLSWSRFFDFAQSGALPGSDFKLQDFTATGDQLYCLSFSRLNRLFAVACTASDGSVQWSWRLTPEKFFTGLSVRSTGSIVLFETANSTSAIVEYSKKGRLIRRRKVGRPPLVSCITGDIVVGAFADTSIEIWDLASDDGFGKRFPGVLSSVFSPVAYPALLVEPVNAGRVAVIDQETATLVVFDVRNAMKARVSRIDCPEVAESLEVYAQERKKLPTRANIVPPKFTVVPAGCSDSGGGLYCMISPVDPPRGALVLQVTEAGDLIRRIRRALPERATGKFRVPLKLSVVRNELYFAFLDGRVASYPLS